MSLDLFEIQSPNLQNVDHKTYFIRTIVRITSLAYLGVPVLLRLAPRFGFLVYSMQIYFLI